MCWSWISHLNHSSSMIPAFIAAFTRTTNSDLHIPWSCVLVYLRLQARPRASASSSLRSLEPLPEPLMKSGVDLTTSQSTRHLTQRRTRFSFDRFLSKQTSIDQLMGHLGSQRTQETQSSSDYSTVSNHHREPEKRWGWRESITEATPKKNIQMSTFFSDKQMK